MLPSELSVQLYTVREAIARDLASALARIADLGFTKVELYDFVDRADKYATLLGSLGLTAPSGHAMLMDSDPGPALDAARRLGLSTVIQPMVAAERWLDREDVVGVARALNEVALAGADRGLQIGYHNHWWELESRIDGVRALEVFADHLDDGVVLEVDAFWAQVGGVEPAELLSRLGERVRFIHVKDGPITLDTTLQVPVGSGDVDIPAVLAAAPQALRVVELDDFGGDVFDALRDSITYLTVEYTGA